MVTQHQGRKLRVPKKGQRVFPSPAGGLGLESATQRQGKGRDAGRRPDLQRTADDPGTPEAVSIIREQEFQLLCPINEKQKPSVYLEMSLTPKYVESAGRHSRSVSEPPTRIAPKPDFDWVKGEGRGRAQSEPSPNPFPPTCAPEEGREETLAISGVP